uniref:Retrotransposon gag domain-containing protein n=1 Tax=Chenopodium quinoa TaxID=63459 RepID=A0A803MSC8_CHEQI
GTSRQSDFHSAQAVPNLPFVPQQQYFMQPPPFGGPAAKNVQLKNVLVGAYDGTTNPEDHLMAFTNLMYLQGLDDPTWCKCFPATLKGIAQQWFGNLPTGCVNSFRTLAY